MSDLKDANVIRRHCLPSEIESDWDEEEIASKFCLSVLRGFEVYLVLFLSYLTCFEDNDTALILCSS